MRPETRTKLFSAAKKKTLLGVLLAMSAGHTYAIEEQEQSNVTKTEQTAVKVVYQPLLPALMLSALLPHNSQV